MCLRSAWPVGDRWRTWSVSLNQSDGTSLTCPSEVGGDEHRVLLKACAACGDRHRGIFPAGVACGASYGTGVKSVLTHLNEGHLLPFARSCEIVADLFGEPLSEGLLEAAVDGRMAALGRPKRLSSRAWPVRRWSTAMRLVCLLRAKEGGCTRRRRRSGPTRPFMNDAAPPRRRRSGSALFRGACHRRRLPLRLARPLLRRAVERRRLARVDLRPRARAADAGRTDAGTAGGDQEGGG